ncbi:urease accessory protein UreF [Methylobacterium sp. Leaf85]|uniref:urease accessory protein UreF n=1 Tax=Methylobacterium sp. Leaf85 TaxID=1736241 RepID=UPI0006F6E2B2|nr:urease accessory UreF family protein [Methylobacterium sp. Leaf85]KQO41637.1 urease accessory protein UreF [Methylobacterium sp. Leaf85]
MIDTVRLMAWLSPGYPVGAYAYSHGLEWAVECGDVGGEASLLAWLGDVLERGAVRTDLILLAHAHAAAEAGDIPALAEVNDLAVALAPTRELHLETTQQGRSFLDATRAAWGSADLDRLSEALPGEVAYPVAVGLSAGTHRMALAPVLAGFGLAFLQNLVSAALRCAPIGQSAGTRVIASLTPRVAALAAAIPPLSLAEIGTATLRLDLGSARHETQYSRIFRS